MSETKLPNGRMTAETIALASERFHDEKHGPMCTCELSRLLREFYVKVAEQPEGPPMRPCGTAHYSVCPNEEQPEDLPANNRDAEKGADASVASEYTSAIPAQRTSPLAEAGTSGDQLYRKQRCPKCDAGKNGDPIRCALCQGHKYVYEPVASATEQALQPTPIPMWLKCPYCFATHIDRDEWASRPHKTHLCEACGQEWRPAEVYTVGIEPWDKALNP